MALTPSLPQEVPDRLHVVPVVGTVPLPGPPQQVELSSNMSQWLLNSADTKGAAIVALVPVERLDDLPGAEGWPLAGVSAVVRQLVKLPDGGVRAVVQPLQRLRLLRLLPDTPLPEALVEIVEDVVTQETEELALAHHLVHQFTRYVELANLPEPLTQAAREQQASPGVLADLIASTLPAASRDSQLRLLAEPSVQIRMRDLSTLLGHELAVLEMGQDIREQVQEEFSQHQREHILREQMRAIQRELGAEDSDDGLRERLHKARLPEAAQAEAERELERLESMPPGAAEASVARTYLDWILTVPWTRRSPERTDIERARRVLEQDHEGLSKIKERILEYVAVRKLRSGHKDAGNRGPVLLLVGPPGVGKTSLGRSVARALGRKFARLSLGGVHDEAEIRGHRRTYVGAMPGRLVQALRKAGTINPVIQLDEIDKVGADHRGDPSSALLEVLDPEQNHAFVDHYLDVPIDLSQVVFIATANRLDTIPAPLRDRIEVLQLSGYSEEEKIQIARQHLLPRQLKAHGLGRRKIDIDDEAMGLIIRRYTHEAGLRNFERELANISRKLARQIVDGARGPFRIGAAQVRGLLGLEKVAGDQDLREDVESTPGLVAGLAWTPAGGEVMYIEATQMAGEGLRLTGQLGDVMKESAQIALSYVRSHADQFDLPADFLQDQEIHVHLPAGAVPKDGPSAGVALTTALVSLLTGVPVRGDLAMTGEVTLRGRVLPVGGIEEKVMAAQRAGLSTVILPRRNERDLEELPANVRGRIEIVLVDDVSEVLATSLLAKASRRQAA